MHSEQTYWTFEDTLTQIGLGYTFLVLIFPVFRSEYKIAMLVFILFAYWLVFCTLSASG